MCSQGCFSSTVLASRVTGGTIAELVLTFQKVVPREREPCELSCARTPRAKFHAALQGLGAVDRRRAGGEDLEFQHCASGKVASHSCLRRSLYANRA